MVRTAIDILKNVTLPDEIGSGDSGGAFADNLKVDNVSYSLNEHETGLGMAVYSGKGEDTKPGNFNTFIVGPDMPAKMSRKSTGRVTETLHESPSKEPNVSHLVSCVLSPEVREGTKTWCVRSAGSPR